MHQLPKIDPDTNYEEYREHLETDGELDLEKVKDLAAEFEWLRKNYQEILLSDLQYMYSKPGTHASWVVQAIQEQQYENKMYEVQDLLELVRGGGYENMSMEESIRAFYEYDEWDPEKR